MSIIIVINNNLYTEKVHDLFHLVKVVLIKNLINSTPFLFHRVDTWLGGHTMVQVDVPVAFAVGTMFADAARRQLQKGVPEYNYKILLQNNIFQIFFFSWIPVYFILNYFGWETTHMWWQADSVTAYPYFVPVFLIIFFGAVNAGFLLGQRLITTGRPLANRVVYIGIFLFSAAWIFGQQNSTFRLGTYAQWQAGNAPWFYEDSTFLTMLIVSLLIWGIGLVWFLRNIIQEGKQLET